MEEIGAQSTGLWPHAASLIRIALVVAIGYPVVMSLIFYLFQDTFIFYPTAISEEGLEWTRSGFIKPEEVLLTSSDGTRLHGWLVNAGGEVRKPLIIYYGGNGEEVSALIMDTPRLKGWSVLLMNYRGYGLSQGSPSEKALFSDALLIYDHVTARSDIDPARVVAFGRSLGTGVAVYLASNRPLAGLILVSPFDSLSSVASAHTRFIPISLLIRHRFDSISRAPSLTMPMLAIAGGADEIVPHALSTRLVEAWGGETRLVLIQGKDHNTLEFNEAYWQSMQDFLVQFDYNQ